MALKTGTPNSLNFFKLRRVEFAAPQFEYVTIKTSNLQIIKKINKWIEANLNSRYYSGQKISLDQNNSIVYNAKIGFEDQKELSFFLLMCPYV